MKTPAERFWAKVDKNGPTMPHMQTPCWTWTAFRSRDGYGRFRLAGRALRAHRVAWELHHEFIPVGMGVLHKCDNPPCVRDDHLFLGTDADNAADMAAKGRVARGEQHWGAKLTEENVISIFRCRRDGWTLERLAMQFGVSFQHISDILSRRRWAHVELGTPRSETQPAADAAGK